MVGTANKGRLMLPILFAASLALSGIACSDNSALLAQKDEEIASLQSKVNGLQSELADERATAEKVHGDLQTQLNEFKQNNQVLVDSLNNMTLITIDEAALFAFSSSHLTDNGTAILDKIAGVVKQHPGRQVWIEGHTDNVPIALEHREKYQSNWEFSSARAHSALRYLLKAHDLDPKKVAAVGYGEHRPIADNSTEDGRAQNRRVVLVIGPQYMKSMSAKSSPDHL